MKRPWRSWSGTAPAGPAYLPWRDGFDWLRPLLEQHRWLPRAEAEASDEFVQPIAAAVIRTWDDHYFVFEWVAEDRADLKGRLSLVVGGHVDGPQQYDDPSPIGRVLECLHTTLERELLEEVALSEVRLSPFGIVLYDSSVAASRHVAMLFQAYPRQRLVVQAVEEFVAQGDTSVQPAARSARRAVRAPRSVVADQLAGRALVSWGTNSRCGRGLRWPALGQLLLRRWPRSAV